MNNFEENAIKIADYLEDKMSFEEEAAFMNELENNEELRKQYEDELMISALLEDDKAKLFGPDNLLFQSADDHIKMVETALQENSFKKKTGLLINIIKDYRTIAAASLLVILLSVFFIFHKEQNTQLVTTDKKIIITDSVNKPDSIPTKLILIPGNTTAVNIYKKFYSPYQGTSADPVEISEYYKSYKTKDYPKVLSATPADYQLMGADSRSKLLDQYMQLYKGLAYLAENKPNDAIQKFNMVLQSSPKTATQYYEAQWYCTLALLKKEDLINAHSLANIIAESSSTYKIKAGEILNEMKEHQ